MRFTPRCVFLSLLMVFAARAPQLQAQQPGTSPHQSVKPDAATYSSDSSSFIVGKRVYLRSTKTYIGTISSVDPDKRFGPKFPRRRMKAVLIDRAEERQDWVPVEGITRIYVTR